MRRMAPIVAVGRAAARERRYVDWVSGACLLVRAPTRRRAGLLDERFFLYTEDVDFCAAIRGRGRRVLFTPAAEIVHLRGRSRASAPAAAASGLPPQPPRVLREAPSALGAAAAAATCA